MSVFTRWQGCATLAADFRRRVRKPVLIIGLASLLLACIPVAVLLRWRYRIVLLRALHALADEQEAALRKLRDALALAHAEIAQLTTHDDTDRDAPVFAEAMREQLEHRLWLRDHAAKAPLGELSAARDAWRRSLRSLVRDSSVLAEAQRSVQLAQSTLTR